MATKRLKTNIKFKKNQATGQFFGFVTKKDSSWRGCEEQQECKKRIVFVDRALSGSIIENALYHATLIPMKSGEGFIAISANLVKFEGKVETIIDSDTFVVNVKFGSRCFTYNPSSKNKKKNDISSIVKMLKGRVDLLDSECVINDFLEAATIALAYYKETTNN